jgi:hypothetical protein
MNSNFVNIRTLQLKAKDVVGDKLKHIENRIQVIQEYENFAVQRGNRTKTFTFVDWQKSQGTDATSNLGRSFSPVTHKQVS